MRIPTILLNRRGWTVIEMSMAIAVLGILSSIVVVTAGNVLSKKRDQRRVRDLRVIADAVMRFEDDHDYFPVTDCPDNPSGWSSFDAPVYIPAKIYATAGCSAPEAYPNLTEALKPYLRPIPKDPNRVSLADAGYLYKSNGSVFAVMIFESVENMHNVPQVYWNFSRCKGNPDANGKCAVNGGFQAITIRSDNRPCTQINPPVDGMC